MTAILNGRYALACVLFCGTLAFARNAPVEGKSRVEILLDQAAQAQHANDWPHAWSYVVQAVEADPTHEQARRQFHHTLRRMAQLARHDDPKYHAFIESLSPAEALNLYATVLTEMGRLYHEAGQATPHKLFQLGIAEFRTALSDPGFRRRALPQAEQVKLDAFLNKSNKHRLQSTATVQAARQELKAILMEARTELGVKHPSIIVGEFVCGACRGLDVYGKFVPPNSDVATTRSLLESYGIIAVKRSDRWRVEAIRDGSWASHQNELFPGDELLRFNDQAIGDEPFIDTIKPSQFMLQYQSRLSAYRPAQQLLLPNPLPSVYGVQFLDNARHIAYLQLAEFNERTVLEMEASLYSLKAQGMQGLVIDIRGNPGGLLSEAILVTEQFLAGGVIVTAEGQSSFVGTQTFNAEPSAERVTVPVVVLIDFQTMSAAEMLAQAWKENRRATLIGMPTFGKGLVQSRVVVSSQGSVLILSIAHLIGPNGQSLDHHGVTPHIVEADPERQLRLAVDKLMELTQD